MLLCTQGAASEFSYDQQTLPGAKPWTSEEFKDNPQEFQFVMIGDRTGGANVAGTFALAIDQLNLLEPEFLTNVGDLIEGYSDDKAELNAEWRQLDEMLQRLHMPFCRTPGNHDIANGVAKDVWLERSGRTHYHFVYKDVLFLVLDSEDPPRTPPEGIREKIDEYNRLQVENPAKAQAMLAEFMADESVVAGHLHYYDYDDIAGNEYITMGPSGASFRQEGPGNVDHIMWVTMTEDGPEMANIALKGLFDRKGAEKAGPEAQEAR